MSSRPARSARAEQKDETRRRLLEAARGVLAERGYDATNVADVARAAGVAHGTLYVHFDGKDAIVDELVASFNAALAAKVAAALGDAAQAPLEDVVRRAARAFFAALAAEADLVRWAAHRLAPHLGVEALRDGVNPPLLAAIEPALAALLTARGASAVPVRAAALGLLALWFRLGLIAVFGPAKGRAEIEDLLVRMTVGAVDALAPPPRTPARPRERRPK